MSVRVRFPSGAHQSLLEEILRGIFVWVILWHKVSVSLFKNMFMAKRRTKEDFETAVRQSISIASMCRYLGLKPCGGNYRIMHNAIDKFSLDTSHFTGKGWNTGLKFKPYEEKTLKDILTEDSSYQSFKLKRRLIKEGVKDHVCECCGLDEWRNNPIPLELHHINGNNRDNRLENLVLLCPNCHALTDSYRGKNKKFTTFVKRHEEDHEEN
jgi:hypothetical protein